MADESSKREEATVRTPQDKLMDMMQEIMGMISQHKAEMATFRRQQQSEDQQPAQTPSTPQHSSHDLAGPDLTKKLAQFKNLAPPPFKEAKNPIKAEEWIETIEEILETVWCEKQDRIRYAEFLLQGDAKQ